MIRLKHVNSKVNVWTQLSDHFSHNTGPSGRCQNVAVADGVGSYNPHFPYKPDGDCGGRVVIETRPSGYITLSRLRTKRNTQKRGNEPI